MTVPVQVISLPRVADGWSGSEVAAQLSERGEPARVACTCGWKQPGVLPEVEARLGYTGEHLFACFEVREAEFRATGMEAGDRVWEDSCVELFVCIDEGDGYYNLEFNAIGGMLLAYGTCRKGREPVPMELARRVAADTTFCRCAGSPRPFRWRLAVKIPWAVFFRHRFRPSAGCRWRGNLYKCGSLLPHPHYLSYYPVEAPRPDFHRPEQFGVLLFT